MNGLDRNGYAPSIVQEDMTCCYVCGLSDQKLDRHEVYGASNRQKSKALGLWIMLCHDRCHLHGVHKHPAEFAWMKEEAQRRAMEAYGWTTEDFIREFGRNYI